MTDEEIEQIRLAMGEDGTANDFARAIIAAHDAELRKQKPVVMVGVSDEDECFAMEYRANSLAEGTHSLYAAPMPIGEVK